MKGQVSNETVVLCWLGAPPGGGGVVVKWFYQLWLRSQFITVKRVKSWHFERLPFVRVRQKSGEGYQKRKIRPPFFFILCAVHPCLFFWGRGGGGLGGLLFHFILAKIYVFRFEN